LSLLRSLAPPLFVRLSVSEAECQLREESVPTYQYRCTACGEDHEAVQSFSDPALNECPRCGGTLRKVFSSVGVVFKGSGFYKTDSRTNSGGAKDRSKDKGDKAKESVDSSVGSAGSSETATAGAGSSSSEKTGASSSSGGSTSTTSTSTSTASSAAA